MLQPDVLLGLAVGWRWMMYSQFPLQTNRWFVDRRWLGWLLLLALSLGVCWLCCASHCRSPGCRAEPAGWAAAAWRRLSQATILWQWGQAMLRLSRRAVGLGAESGLALAVWGPVRGHPGGRGAPAGWHYVPGGDDRPGGSADLPNLAGDALSGAVRALNCAVEWPGGYGGGAVYGGGRGGSWPGAVAVCGTGCPGGKDGARCGGGASPRRRRRGSDGGGQWGWGPGRYRLLPENQVALSLGIRAGAAASFSANAGQSLVPAGTGW